MWKYSESAIRPLELDKDSSESVVYMRRNIVMVDKTDDRPEMYQYEENKIPVGNWEIYEQLINDSENISDVQDALCEIDACIDERLAEIEDALCDLDKGE